MNISLLFRQMLVLFSIILLGVILTKKNIMNAESNKLLSRLIVTLTNPLQVLSSVLSGDRPLANMQVLELTLLSFAMYAFLIACAAVLPRLMRIRDRQDAGIYRFLLVLSNVGYMGYPVIESLFGAEYKFYATVFVMAFQLVCWSYGVSLISGEKLKLSKELFLRPMIISALLSYAIYFADITPLYKAAPEVMGVVYSVTHTVGSITSPLAMLIIGGALAQQKLRDIFNKWRIYVLVVVKMVLLPIAGFLLLRPVIADRNILGVMTVIMAMPSATNATIISYQYGGNEKLASAGVFLTTLLSVFSIPAVMYLLFFMI